MTPRRVPFAVSRAHVREGVVAPGSAAAVVPFVWGVEEGHRPPPGCLHRANSDEQGLQGVVVVVSAAADLVRLEEAHRQVKGAVGDGSDSFRRLGRANTTR